MNRNFLTRTFFAVAVACLPSLAGAVIYSPTQTEFLGLEFADFIDNANPDFASLNSNVAAGLDGVTLNFTNDFDINDNLWRVAMENTNVAWDLSTFDAFSVTFSNPVPPEPGLTLSAQIFVRSVSDTVFIGTSALPLNASSPITLSIPKQRIIDFGGDPADISSFGIEFFGGDEFAGTTFSATASTSPQPPTLEDHTLFSWETADNPGTPSIDERFEGWTALNGGAYTPGTLPHPDHTHLISTNGATDGTKALQINRLVTGTGLPDSPATTTFRWGSRLVLDANAGGGGAAIGDYNNDTAVDAVDYTVWRNNLGQPASSIQNRDPDNGTGPVNANDYTSWKENYGSAGGGPNQVVLDQIAEIVELVNDPDAYSISFDIRFEDQIPDPNPGWSNFFVAIQATDGNPGDGNDAWWQGAQAELDMSPLASGNPVVATLDFPLALFDDANESGTQSLKTSGLDPATQYLIINLASNAPIDSAPITYEYYIDNFRVRHIVPDEGSGGLAVPEPSTALLLFVALAGMTAVRRTRS
jgi:hypothetical protein